MPQFPQTLYIIGSAICAQIASHSFFYQGKQLPLDARCTGIYLGFLVVFIFWLFRIRKKPNDVFPLTLLVPVSFSILYLAFDGFSSIFRANWVSNFTRLASGLFFGQSLGLLVLTVLSDSLWGRAAQKNKIINWPSYLSLLLISCLIFVFFWLNIQPVIYLFGFLSILGLILLALFINFAILSAVFSKIIFTSRLKNILFFNSFVLSLIEFIILLSTRRFFGL